MAFCRANPVLGRLAVCEGNALFDVSIAPAAAERREAAAGDFRHFFIRRVDASACRFPAGVAEAFCQLGFMVRFLGWRWFWGGGEEGLRIPSLLLRNGGCAALLSGRNFVGIPQGLWGVRSLGRV